MCINYNRIYSRNHYLHNKLYVYRDNEPIEFVTILENQRLS